MIKSSRGRRRIERSSAAVLRWFRAISNMLGHTWRRSLQLRVVVSTLTLSLIVIVILGVVLTSQITDRLLEAKISAATDVLRYDALLDHFEARNGVAGLEYIVPVEMVAAIQNARGIATASPRVGAMIGPTAEHADIARAVGYRWTPEGEETLYLRSRVLLACREAGIHPLTGLWERLDDLVGLKTFAGKGRQLGFRGMIAIHPSHVPVVNEAFTPTADEVEFHEGLLAAYAVAAAAGSGAVRYRGVHIDKAHVDTARDWLAHARSLPGAAGPAVPTIDAPEGGR